MSTTVFCSSKSMLLSAMIGLGMLLTPAAPVHAQGNSEPVTPPAPAEKRSLRLERVWNRQLRIHDRLVIMFDHAQQRITGAQELIDRAATDGKDVSALQASLEAFSDALQEARPVFESTKSVIASHKGFDANGKVTDAELAAGTVTEMVAKLQQLRNILFDPGKALRGAIRAFREANRPK